MDLWGAVVKRQTPIPRDWHDVGRLLGLDPIRTPRPIAAQVDTGCLDRIRRQIEDDRRAGLLPPRTQAAACPVCKSPHPAGEPCKPLEASDNGYTLTRRGET